MKTINMTLLAIQDDEPVAEASASIDLDTFELSNIDDTEFLDASEDDYDGFAIEIGGKVYPIGVDFLSTGNEFMLMDSDGINAILDYADENADEVETTAEVDDDGNEIEVDDVELDEIEEQ